MAEWRACEAYDGPPYRQCRLKARTRRKRAWGKFEWMCDRHAAVFDEVKKCR